MSENLAYFMNSAAYSLAGFIVGWIASTILNNRTADAAKAEGETEPRKRPFPRDLVFGGFLLVLAILTVGSGLKQAATKSCQVDFNTRSAQVTSTRAMYADEDRRALVNYLTTVDSTQIDSVSAQSALHRLLDTYQETQRKRDAAPLPSLKEACK